MTTENMAVYKTILGLILSAIRSLDPTAAATDEMPPLIPDEDTSWMQISETDDAADILRKTLAVLSAIAKVFEIRNQDGRLPIVNPAEPQEGAKGDGQTHGCI